MAEDIVPTTPKRTNCQNLSRQSGCFSSIALLILINYLLEIGLLNLFLWIGAGELLAPILVMIIVVPINFLILHFVYIYKGRK